MVPAYLFKPATGIRYSQSPTGGGALNPAWDFQLIVPDFEVGKGYSFQAKPASRIRAFQEKMTFRKKKKTGSKND
jgi:hypothetical protein